MPLRAGDIKNIPDTGGMVAEGKHIAKVTAAGEEQRNDGALVWGLTFTTETGDVKERIFWTERAMFRGKVLCEALGIDLDSDPDAEVNASGLIGKICEIEVEHEEFDGRDGKKHRGAKITVRGFTKLSDEVLAQATTQQPAKAGVSRLFG